MSGRGIGALVAAACMLWPAAVATAADTVSVQGSTLVLTGDDTDGNVLVTWVKDGAQTFTGVQAGPGCYPNGGGWDHRDRVDCPLDGVTSFSANTGGGNDSLMFKPEDQMSLPVTASMGSGNDWYYDGGTRRDVVDLGDGNDHASDGYGEDVYDAGPGDDFVIGRVGPGIDSGDEVSGGPGNDQLQTLDGADRLDGGPDNDNLHGGEGDDVSAGGDGDDWVHGSRGDDVATGGEGNDIFAGGVVNFYERRRDPCYDPGDDALDGGPGHDRLCSDEGVDSMVGGDGNDFFQGSLGNDTVTGGEGDDFLGGELTDAGPACSAEPGEDTLDGGPGEDQLCGGEGIDSMAGGDGNDRINSLDGVADALVSCGGGIDAWWADAFDPLSLDCEQQAQPGAVPVGPGGAVPVPIGCPGSCTGRLVLSLAPDAEEPTAAQPPPLGQTVRRRRSQRLASRRFRLRRGASSLTVRLDRAVRRRVRRLGEPSVEARATVTTRGGQRFVLRKTFRVRAHRPSG